jgi:uncharacterized lipoprotein YbaY
MPEEKPVQITVVTKIIPATSFIGFLVETQRIALPPGARLVGTPKQQTIRVPI